MPSKTKDVNKLKVNTITIEQLISVLEHFNKDSKVRFYQISPTKRTEGYIMVGIDLPIENSIEPDAHGDEEEIDDGLPV